MALAFVKWSNWVRGEEKVNRTVGNLLSALFFFDSQQITVMQANKQGNEAIKWSNIYITLVKLSLSLSSLFLVQQMFIALRYRTYLGKTVFNDFSPYITNHEL